MNAFPGIKFFDIICFIVFLVNKNANAKLYLHGLQYYSRTYNISLRGRVLLLNRCTVMHSNINPDPNTDTDPNPRHHTIQYSIVIEV